MVIDPFICIVDSRYDSCSSTKRNQDTGPQSLHNMEQLFALMRAEADWMNPIRSQIGNIVPNHD